MYGVTMSMTLFHYGHFIGWFMYVFQQSELYNTCTTFVSQKIFCNIQIAKF